MKLNRNLLKCITIIASILIPVSFAFRICAYFLDLDVATGFFLAGSTACTVANGLGLFVFALCLVFAFLKKDLPDPKKKELPPLTEDDLYDESFPFPEEKDELILETAEEEFLDEIPPELPLLEGCAKKAAVWTGTLSAFATFLPGFGFTAYAIAFFLQNRAMGNIFSSIHVILSLFSALFFLLLSFRNSPVKSKTLPFFALSPAIWCTLRMVIEYRDLTRFMNKALYIGQFLFIISALIFFLYQAELLLGEEKYSNPNFYGFFAVSTLFFGLCARLPHLIAGISGKVSFDLIDASSLLIDLAITLFAAAKLSAILKKD